MDDCGIIVNQLMILIRVRILFLHESVTAGCPEDEAGQERTNGRRGDDDTLNDADKIAIEKDDLKKISEDEKVKLTYVDYVTGNPLPNDILTLMPVCAPYTALQSYQYSQDNPWNNKERKRTAIHNYHVSD
uniref:Nuclear export mediator factor NEMF isoform X1 n=1 Tax=Tanacetum cinerariifolium TaxID=118510 RepID=A0A699IB16_TANCI|nr:nuclear export mediator factor NEMF isoform X1 [Tanacetum cinerariifolium]